MSIPDPLFSEAERLAQVRPSSDEVTVVLASAVPSKPSLSVAGGNAQVTLTGSVSTGSPILRWQYQQKTGNSAWGSWNDIANNTSMSLSHKVTGLTYGTTYKFKVRAVNSLGDGAVSASPGAATPTAPCTAPSSPPPERRWPAF